jgi:hypothetical protein
VAFIGPARFLQQTFGDLIVSKRKLRQAESIACVRLKRNSAEQNVGFVSRPFVRCGLPIKRPPPGTLLHERRNGRFVLQVAGLSLANNSSAQKLLCCNAFISVMKAAELWNCDNLSCCRDRG